MNKTENIKKRTLQFVLNDYNSNYETLLKKSSRCTMEVHRLQVLALAVFCSVNKRNPVYMLNLFEKNVDSKRHNNALQVPIRNSGTCCQQS